MRPAVLVMVIAVFAAILTAMLARSWLERQVPAPVVAEGQPMTEILVVTRDVASGATLQSDDLRYEKWPDQAITPRLIVRQPDSDPKAQYVGRIARRPLAEGEPLSSAALFRTDASGVLAGLLAPGMRAVSISITNPSAVSGFVTPGDKVDIVLAADFQNNLNQDKKSSSAIIQRFAAETVLTDVKVLAIDQQITRGHDGAAIQGKTATIEVTSKQAEVLTAAGLLGTLPLVLRGLPADKAEQEQASLPADSYTGDTEASKALKKLVGTTNTHAPSSNGGAVIQINRAGVVSSEGITR